MYSRWQVPGSDPANTARWAGLTPEQRALEQSYADHQTAVVEDRLRRSRRFGNIAKMGVLGTVAAGAGAGALGAMFTGGGAAGAAQGAGWSMPGVTAPVFGVAGATAPAATAATAASPGILSKMFTSPLVGTLVNAGTSLLGQRSQNKAADQARADTLKAQAEALALQRQQLELEARNADLDREDARALNAAINELKKRELDAAEEVRAFERTQYEARETRRVPYRQAGDAALKRLQVMWGIG